METVETMQEALHTAIAKAQSGDIILLSPACSSYDQFPVSYTHLVVIGNGNSIVAQFPKAGDAIMSNQRMFLLSDGAKIAMPNMKGWTKKDITAFWNLTHIEVQMEGSGSVHSQNVKMGKTISKDTKMCIRDSIQVASSSSHWI